MAASGERTGRETPRRSIVGRRSDAGGHERVYVTVHGKPSAVLLATEDLESLAETIEILADADAMRRLHASDAELGRGEVETRQDLDAAMQRRRTTRRG